MTEAYTSWRDKSVIRGRESLSDSRTARLSKNFIRTYFQPTGRLRPLHVREPEIVRAPVYYSLTT